MPPSLGARSGLGDLEGDRTTVRKSRRKRQHNSRQQQPIGPSRQALSSAKVRRRQPGITQHRNSAQAFH